MKEDIQMKSNPTDTGERMMRRSRRGLTGLRAVRLVARIKGNRQMVSDITDILRDDDKAEIAGAILEDEIDNGTPIQDFIQFIIDNWEAIEKIIKAIMELFAGMETPAT